LAGKDGKSVGKNYRINPTYTLQISVDYLVVMKIVKTAGDPNQLRSSEHRTWMPMHWAYQFQSIDLRVSPHIIQYISTLHPLRHHTKLKQFWRYAFNGQDVWMVNPLRNYGFLEVFLDPISI